ncbi:MAG: hypothetical protein ACI9BV_002567, partial [Rhodothermales bacterium]
ARHATKTSPGGNAHLYANSQGQLRRWDKARDQEDRTRLQPNVLRSTPLKERSDQITAL